MVGFLLWISVGILFKGLVERILGVEVSGVVVMVKILIWLLRLSFFKVIMYLCMKGEVGELISFILRFFKI